MLDHLNLMNIFQHFAFCTRTCHINDICRLCSRLVYENSNLSQKSMLLFKTVKLVDLSCMDMKTMFKSRRYWHHSLDICNPNDKFISVNETRKCGCLLFKTCNNEAQACLVFIEILLNTIKNIYENFTEKYAHNYSLEFFHDECFTHAYQLIYKFLRRTRYCFLKNLC